MYDIKYKIPETRHQVFFLITSTNFDDSFVKQSFYSNVIDFNWCLQQPRGHKIQVSICVLLLWILELL